MSPRERRAEPPEDRQGPPDHPPKVLSVLAALLVRGPEARFILSDLDEHLARDIEGGMTRRRALWRYVHNLLGSALSLWRVRLHVPRLSALAPPLSVPRPPSMAWLDVKLGARMLVKYPLLSLVGGLGIAVAIAIGASFAAARDTLYATLPFEGGERIVALENWDTAINNQETQILHDFVQWRDGLESVESVGAFDRSRRNLIAADGAAEPVVVAKMSAAGFEVTRVPPLLGRTLVDEDEREGAPEVVVIGHDVWQERFGGDPRILGRTLQIGTTRHTVVGVMPEGFAFPVNDRFWVPLRADPSDWGRRQGPGIEVFGRLAPGATLESAQAELDAMGRRAAAAFPATHERLVPRVSSYTHVWLDDMEGWEFPLMQFLVVLLLLEICVNVGILVYARTATRRGEIAVRSALGASRRRIVGQLFVEALVLSGAAAAVGLGIAAVAADRTNAAVDSMAPAGAVPFWLEFGLTSGTVVHTLGLTVLAAVVVGVVPALKATGRRAQSGLQRLAVGASGWRFGRTWTGLIVAQVAFAVAVLPVAASTGWTFLRHGTAGPGFAAEEFLTTWLMMERQTPPATEAGAYEREFLSRYAAAHAELARRLEAEPAVSDVIVSRALPGGEPLIRVEVEGVPTPTGPDGAVRAGSTGHRVGIGRVDVDFFDAFDVPVLSGRGFDAGDLGPAARAVIVNRTFVEEILGDGDVLGRRVRHVGRGGDAAPGDIDMGRWYEIVGVVSDFPSSPAPGSGRAKLYHAEAPGQLYPLRLTLRVRGGRPAAFAGQLREIAAALDPTLQLPEILPLDDVLGQDQMGMRLTALAIAIVTLSVLLLSAAGIYALMSFTVARRRREIGIRTALGGQRRRILASIFSRALGQLSIGIVAGLAVTGLLDRVTGGELTGGAGAALLAGVAAFMMAVGLLATLGPARRGLRVQPTEALRAE